MSLEDLLLRGRARAEELMVDECEVERPGDSTFNDDTGQWESPVATPVYAGKCKVQSQGSRAQPGNPESAEAVLTIVNTEVHFPAETDIRDGDLVKVTASRFASSLVGRVFRIEGFVPDSTDTAWRAPVEVHT